MMPGTNLTDLIEPYVIDLHQEDKIPENSHKPKIIAFYAEKGGVGKTTLCLTLAHTMAAQGSRVLIYDCDVQRSLTAWTFGNNIEINARNNPRLVNKLDNFIHNLPYDKNKLDATLYEQVIDEDHNVKPAYASKIKDNLYLVCGDSRMPLLDEKIANTEAMTSEEFASLMRIPNLKSARPYYAIMKTAEKYQVDYVFLDMNPYPSILNRCLLMSSHYIVIPALLDFFCDTMMNMMSKNLEDWNAKTRRIVSSTNRQGGMFPWPNDRPKFLGYITSIYMLYPESMPSPSELSNGDGWASEAGTG
jgi:chromosome partitioning protein